MDYTRYILFSEYIIDIFRDKNAQNPSFSVRAFSKFLGYKNPTLLNDILRKKRKPTIELALRVVHKFSYPKHQADYLIKICEYERAKSTQERDLIMVDLRKLLSQKKWQNIEVDLNELLSRPFVFLIYNMIALKGFKADATFLNKRLRLKVTQKQVDQALDALVRLRYIKVDKNGNYHFTQEQTIMSAQSSPKNPQVTDKFHQNLIEMTHEAIENYSPSERDLRSIILPIRKSDFPLIVDEIIQAHQKSAAYTVDAGADEVYIFSTQLIPFTAQPSDK